MKGFKIKKKYEDKQKNIKWKYILMICILAIFCICLYIAIVYIFTKTDFLHAEAVLDKKDWLSFFGIYLSFVGTMTISIITVYQTSNYKRQEKELKQEEYEQATMPKLAISIINVNSWVEGMEECESREEKLLHV